ncbi:MAG: hypothetical protein ACFFFG_07840 [Candidatus Thorarchaeota archaeon]
MSQVVEPVSLMEAIDVLAYNGPLFSSEKKTKRHLIPHKSVELVPSGISEDFLFYLFMCRGFVVHSSPTFQNPFFRVKYFYYDEEEYNP